MTDFCLSDRIQEDNSIYAPAVKEFIRLLKEEIKGGILEDTEINNIIDKLAGDKLI